MKQNSKILQDDKIDLDKIIKTFWDEKVLIFCISLFFMFAAFVYSIFQPKIYKTVIILNETPSYLFQGYRSHANSQSYTNAQQLQKQQQQQQPLHTGFASIYDKNIKSNLSSIDTLLKFVEDNDKISDFKNHLKEKGISHENYFKGKFQKVPDMNQNIPNKYSLTYTPPLPAETFLNDYIMFVHQQTLETIKKEIIQNIQNEIVLHEESLKIAQLVGLENPILQAKNEILINEPESLFYNGTKVLSQKIIHLKNLLIKTKNLTIDYNPILEKSSSSELLSKPSIFFVTISFVFSLFLSFIVIYLKSIFKIKY